MTQPNGTPGSSTVSSAGRSPLAIVILTRDRWPVVDRCLGSIYQQALNEGVPVHLLVNNSRDDTAERARTSYPAIHIHRSDVNLGCPGGRNHLMGLVEAEWVAHIDDDGTVADDFLSVLAAEIGAAPRDRVVIGGNIVDVDLDPQPALAGGRTNRFSGGICALRRSTFLELGGYPTDGLRQGEEGDYAIRLHDAGHHIWRSANLVLFHPLRHSAAKRRELLRTGLRQSVLTGVRYCPAWAVVPWTAWKMAVHLQLAVRLRAPRPYLAGARDALRLLPSTLKSRRPVSMRAMLSSTTRFS